MALTEKMIERAKELLASRGRSSSAFDTEACVKAYIEHGSLQKAAEAIGCSYPTMRRRVHKAIGRPGFSSR